MRRASASTVTAATGSCSSSPDCAATSARSPVAGTGRRSRPTTAASAADRPSWCRATRSSAAPSRARTGTLPASEGLCRLTRMALTEAIQDYLEKLYWFEEAGIEPTQANLARAMQVSQPSVTEMVRRLVDEGLIERDERKRLRFTPKGEEVAHHIVSRHRLIEVFLVKVLGIPWDEVHEEAHTFEHAISPTIEQQMQKLLAEATTCPHGHPIGDAQREAGEILV